MKQVLALVAVLVFLLAGCANEGAGKQDRFVAQIVSDYPELKNKNVEIADIGRIVDGDTYETVSGEKIRAIGVNTPEVHGKTQYFGKEASEFSKERLKEQTVYLFKDVSDTDRYGRLLRYVFIKDDPVMFNETLLVEGYANTMTIPPDVAFAEKFVTLEREARDQGKGLWGEKADTQTIPPVGGESGEAVLSCENPEIKGNINSRGEKIYHMPGGRYYERTIAEQMFCTEAEAEAAGFRKAMQ